MGSGDVPGIRNKARFDCRRTEVCHRPLPGPVYGRDNRGQELAFRNMGRSVWRFAYQCRKLAFGVNGGILDLPGNSSYISHRGIGRHQTQLPGGNLCEIRSRVIDIRCAGPKSRTMLRWKHCLRRPTVIIQVEITFLLLKKDLHTANTGQLTQISHSSV